MGLEDIDEGYFFSFGNPLLDIIAEVDDEIYRKYGLEKDNAILAEPKHMPIYDEIEQKYSVKHAAGGAAMNTCRMIQWLIDKPKRCSFVGCIADDRAGRFLQKECKRIGLHTEFQITLKGTETGKCAVLVQGNLRSMVTNPAAVNDLSVCHFAQEKVWRLVEQAQVFYVAGFAICSCFEGIRKIARYTHTNGKLFCFNLSSPFIPTFFKDQVDEIMGYVDVLFANAAEAKAYAENHNMHGWSIRSIAEHIAFDLHKDSPLKRRIVIFTNGADPVIVADSSKRMTFEYPMKKVDSHAIVDTNGAGDAFVAGFLVSYAESKSIERAIKLAGKAARYILQRPGFSLDSRDFDVQ